MGVAIYCCSRNQKPQNPSYNQSFVFDEQIHKDINMNTNCSGKLNNSNINSLKNKKDPNVNQKHKQSNM